MINPLLPKKKKGMASILCLQYIGPTVIMTCVMITVGLVSQNIG